MAVAFFLQKKREKTAELYTIYQDTDVVNASLSKAGGGQFGTRCYWSCCQHDSNAGARSLDFTDGSIYDGWKNFDGDSYVCSVRAFN